MAQSAAFCGGGSDPGGLADEECHFDDRGRDGGAVDISACAGDDIKVVAGKRFNREAGKIAKIHKGKPLRALRLRGSVHFYGRTKGLLCFS
jgi:hypothetical protein